MNGWPPEGVRVGKLPAHGGGEDGGDAASEARLIPCPGGVFPHGAGGTGAVLKLHARDRDALAGGVPAVVAEEEVEVLPVAVQDHGKISVTAREEAVCRGAIHWVARIENDAQVMERTPVIVGNGRADSGSRERAAADAGRLVMIPAVERAVAVEPGGFDPDRQVFRGVHPDRTRRTELELIAAPADLGGTRRHEEVQAAVAPVCRAVTVGKRGHRDLRRGAQSCHLGGDWDRETQGYHP